MANDKTRENEDRLEADLIIPGGSEEDLMIAQSARVSDRTNIHDAGSDANDTDDGLNEEDEAVRHAAEDIPTGQDPLGPVDSIPVFDRGSLPPKI